MQINWRWHRDRDYRAEFVRAHDAAVDAAVAGREEERSGADHAAAEPQPAHQWILDERQGNHAPSLTGA